MRNFHVQRFGIKLKRLSRNSRAIIAHHGCTFQLLGADFLLFHISMPLNAISRLIKKRGCFYFWRCRNFRYIRLMMRARIIYRVGKGIKIMFGKVLWHWFIYINWNPELILVFISGIFVIETDWKNLARRRIISPCTSEGKMSLSLERLACALKVTSDYRGM